VTSITRTLAEYLAQAGARSLPYKVQERTRLHLLDTFVAMVSGATLAAGRHALEYVRHESTSDDGTVIGSDMTATAADAALANGMSGHADETDDSHPAGFHPGCHRVCVGVAADEAQQRLIVDVAQRVVVQAQRLPQSHRHRAGAKR
jgi:2-methylcitrate dehydratase PrpD